MTPESVLRTRQLPCWIEGFTDATKDLPAPELFRKWTAISCIAGALERRVWAETAMSRIYPNLFVLFVAPPGVGKTEAIKLGSRLANQTKKLKIAPDDLTKPALIDHVSRSTQTKTYPPSREHPGGEMIQYHSLHIFADELGVFIPSHDTGFLSVMNKLFDNAASYTESRRGREEDLVIENPQTNLLAGTQPDFLANLLPPEAWGMGFMSRMLMVYQGTPVKVSLFGKRHRPDYRPLLEDLKVVAELHGEMEWDKGAEDLLVSWHDNNMEPRPTHTKLKHYLPRRILNIIKLCVISAVSRGNDMTILREDVERARDWLLEIEALMPDIFKDMSGVSDITLIQELHYYVWELYAKSGKKGIHRSRIDLYLAAKTPAYNREHIIKTCIAARILIEQPGDMFIPGAKNTLTDEES